MKPDRRAAFLRGINVGRAKRIAMADLRNVVSSLGYGNVQTLLNSGNVVFDVPKGTKHDVAARLEKAIAGSLGVSSRVTVLTADELSTVIAENTIAELASDASRLLVSLLREPGDRAKVLPLLKEVWEPDALAVGSRAVYAWCGGGILESRLASTLGRLLGDGATTRNWATLLKVQALVLP
ncbi:MAG: DUF1697 domain-containing protein [Acidobacteria bacterium]|nr:DUF1697 domain-containing protein [Acidobacteriota bacterium]